MKLEQRLEMYQPMQMQRVQERERVYTIVNLESLSASALYMGDNGRHVESYGGNLSWGQSFGRSTDYIKQTEIGELHVHSPKGFVTGVNLDGNPISNYEASMIYLLPGKIIKDTGKW